MFIRLYYITGKELDSRERESCFLSYIRLQFIAKQSFNNVEFVIMSKHGTSNVNNFEDSLLTIILYSFITPCFESHS